MLFCDFLFSHPLFVRFFRALFVRSAQGTRLWCPLVSVFLFARVVGAMFILLTKGDPFLMQVDEHGDEFVECCISFLAEKLVNMSDGEDRPNCLASHLETAATIFKVLISKRGFVLCLDILAAI